MMPLWLRRGVICRQFHATLMHRKRKGGNKAFEPKRPWAPRRSSNSRHSRNDGVHGEPNARRRALRRAEETAFNPAEVSLAMLDERADAKFAGVVEDLLSPLGYAELPGWPDLRKKDPDRLWNSIRAQRKRTTVLFPAQLQNLLDLYSYLIRVLSAHGRFSEAYAVVWNCEVTSLDTHLNDKAYTAVLHGAAISGCMDASDEVWQLMQSKGETPSSHAWSARLLALCRNHLMDRAQREVQVMVASGQCLSIVHYTTLMNGYVGVGNVTEAWRWWRKMIQAGIEPDVMTYTVMLKACAKGGLFEKAMGLMEELEMRQLLPTRYTFNALLRATASAPLWIRAYGGVIEGVKMRMEGYDLPPNEDTFCALLECYGSGGDADGVRVTVEELLHWMSLRKSAKPLHEQTYRAILSAWAKCMSAGEVLGVKPRYGCLPEQAALELKLKSEYRQIVVSDEGRKKLEHLRASYVTGNDSLGRQPKSKQRLGLTDNGRQPLVDKEDEGDVEEGFQSAQSLADFIIAQEEGRISRIELHRGEEMQSALTGGEQHDLPQPETFLPHARALRDSKMGTDVSILGLKPGDFELMSLSAPARRARIESLAADLYQESIAVHGHSAPVASAMLSVYAEALEVDKAERFLESYLDSGLRPKRAMARTLVRMLCRAKEVDQAFEVEERSRVSWGLPADAECLGMILNEAAKRDDHERMRKVLDICLAAQCLPREFWLLFVRRNERCAGFSHPALLPDPSRHVKELQDRTRRQPQYSATARLIQAKFRS